MSIVKMKRLRLIGFSEERKDLVAKLLHLGCVEVTEPDDKLSDPQWAALVKRDTSNLADAKAQAGSLTSALDALKKYAPAKTGLFIKRSDISEADFFNDQVLSDALACAEEINRCTREISKIYSRENKLKSTIASLTPWAGLDLPLEVQRTVTTSVLLGVCPATVELSALESDLAAAAELAELQMVSEDKDQKYFLLVCHQSQEEDALNALRPHSFSTVHFKDMEGTAAENIGRLEKEMAELETQRAEAEAAIAAKADMRSTMQICQDRVNQDISKEAVCERFLTDGTIFFLEGWIPAENLPQLEEAMKDFTCAFESADPAEGETPPTKLKNPKWMDSINMVTEMYSLPAYDGIDPNPLMFFWYVFFFGFMFADVAYGIIIFAACLAIIKLFNPKKTMGRMFHLGLWLGGSTAFCGIFVGGFFGNVLEVIYQNFVPAGIAAYEATGSAISAMPGWMQAFCNGILVNPINDPMKVLIIAIAIGCVQLIMGQCIHIYMCFRDGHGVDGLLDVVPWWIVFAGIACIALLGTPWVLVAGAVALLVTQGRHAPSIVGKIMGGFKSWYDITSWLSDVLSYARLMALMLATSVIAQVFNTLGTLPSGFVVKLIVFVIVFLIGHLFNIGVNLIGTYVHAARLQYLEYFGKFYKDGGIPFQPLQYDTKYVDVVNNKEEK